MRAEGGVDHAGCLIGLTAVFAPRVLLVLAWIFADRWTLVWNGDILMPLLGIIFLPYTTIMYVLVWTPDGIAGFAWMWLLLGLILDLMHWGQVLTNRKAGTEYAQSSSILRHRRHGHDPGELGTPGAEATRCAGSPALRDEVDAQGC